MYTIYKITNTINTKTYIGKTCNINRRWKEHLYEFKKNNSYKLYRAMQKYKVENFAIKSIFSVLNIIDFNEFEIYFIHKYNSFYDGYNMTLGGEGFHGEQHPSRIGNYYTPFGKLLTTTKIIDYTNEISPSTISKWTKNPDKIISAKSICRSKYLQSFLISPIGKSYRDIGFWFEPFKTHEYTLPAIKPINRTHIKIINDYLSGISIYALTKKHILGRKKIKNILIKNKVPLRKKNIRIDIENNSQQIIQEYTNGTSVLKLAQHYNCNRKVINRILKENNIKHRSLKESRKTRSEISLDTSLLKNNVSIKNIIETHDVSKFTAIKLRKENNITTHASHIDLTFCQLYNLHIIEKCSASEIGRKLHCHYQTIINRLEKFHIPFNASYNSNLQNELKEFLNSLNIKYVENKRTIISPYELDFYLPEHNLAIEFNGVYWHSELNGKNKQYHLKKTELCETKGIHLLQIFDSEWNNSIKQQIWKSIISSKLKLNNRIYARKCKIHTPSSREVNIFLTNNHLQGYCSSQKQIGLYYNNKLVSLMTFGKSRFSKEMELIRYCNKVNINVIGGASRLLKASKFTNIISYANRRFSNGGLYIALNFKKIHDTDPNYFYTKDYKLLETRHKYQKHKLSELLTNFKNNLSEWENMKINGYDRIWDCGNIKYQYVST